MGAGTLAAAEDRHQRRGCYKYFSMSSPLPLQCPVRDSHGTLTRSWLLTKPVHRNVQESVPWDTTEGSARDLKANGASGQHTGRVT